MGNPVSNEKSANPRSSPIKWITLCSHRGFLDYSFSHELVAQGDVQTALDAFEPDLQPANVSANLTVGRKRRKKGKRSEACCHGLPLSKEFVV